MSIPPIVVAGIGEHKTASKLGNKVKYKELHVADGCLAMSNATCFA